MQARYEQEMMEAEERAAAEREQEIYDLQQEMPRMKLEVQQFTPGSVDDERTIVAMYKLYEFFLAHEREATRLEQEINIAALADILLITLRALLQEDGQLDKVCMTSYISAMIEQAVRFNKTMRGHTTTADKFELNKSTLSVMRKVEQVCHDQVAKFKATGQDERATGAAHVLNEVRVILNEG